MPSVGREPAAFCINTGDPYRRSTGFLLCLNELDPCMPALCGKILPYLPETAFAGSRMAPAIVPQAPQYVISKSVPRLCLCCFLL